MMANRRLVSEPVAVPDAPKNATPMERLSAFARRIVHVPKDEVEAAGKDQKPQRSS